MPESAGEKSFDATPHRRQQAREKGQVAFSQDLGSAVLLVLAVLLLMMMGGKVADLIGSLMRRQLGELTDLAPAPMSFVTQGQGIMLSLGAVLLPIMGLLMLGGILSSVLQVGLMYVPRPGGTRHQPP